MPKIYNIYHNNAPKDAIYIGRPTVWGNPFKLGKDGNREEVFEKYCEWVLKNELYVERIKDELKGKDLVCWCKPKLCHGDILLEIANGE